MREFKEDVNREKKIDELRRIVKKKIDELREDLVNYYINLQGFEDLVKYYINLLDWTEKDDRDNI